MNNKTPAQEPVIPLLVNLSDKEDTSLTSKMSLKTAKEEDKEASLKKGYGVSVSYGPGDFNPRSEEYWKASQPVFNELKSKFKVNMKAIEKKRIAEARMKHPEIVDSKGNRTLIGQKSKVLRVQNITTGLIYSSIKDAAEDYYTSYEYLYRQLTGRDKNNTDLIMLDK